MGVFEIIGAVAMIVISVLIVLIVSLQDTKSDGISALAGASAFISSSGDRSKSGKLNKITKILAIAFFVITIAVYAISVYLVK